MKRLRHLSLAVLCVAMSGRALMAADLRILLPLGRTAYQTNEQIDLALVRAAPQALAAGDLVLALTGDEGSAMTFRFSLPAVALTGNDARATEHLHLNGRLLRPGRYKLLATADGATATAAFEVFSHVRKSTYKLITWGSSARDKELEAMGEDSLGFNLLYLNGLGDYSIRGGVDWMQNDIEGGGAQMDLRGECDWSDPYVIRGGAARLTRAAMMHRRQPNAIGSHFYDELMLAEAADPVTKERTPHSVPAQHLAYRAAFGQEMVPYRQIDPNKPEDAATWDQWARWKLSLLDGNHKLGRFAVEYVRPDYISTNQTQCWWLYFATGNYFNVARSLPVISGHCWYDFSPPDYFAPTQFLEIARARELAKANWFLPTWFTFASPTRVEHNLAFMTGIQGMMIPPEATVHKPSTPNPGGLDQTAAIVESNKMMARLGTIFTNSPAEREPRTEHTRYAVATRPPVAMLYSLSHNIHTQTLDMNFKGNGDSQYYAVMFLYVAGKMIQNPFFTVVDEDVVDGTLAAHHKAVVLGGIDYLAPDVVAGLEAFAANGGLVLLSADCTVKLKGATVLSAKALHPEQEKIYQLLKDKKYGDITGMLTITELLRLAEPLAAEIKGHLEKAGIAPVFECDSRGIAAYRQAEGDIEYLFAANATPDADLGTRNALRAATATIGIPADGRPVYDALLGRPMPEFKKSGAMLKADLRFGPGQMRVFARTARPIGGVHVLAPAIITDFTLADTPIRVQLGATLLDTQGGVLSGSAPLQIRVVDPLGVVRYDLYRATKLGTLREDLPLAANDPAGKWTVSVRELLSGREGQTTFAYRPASQCGAVAGLEPRAVHFGLDREHIYRFFRTQRSVTIMKGTADFHGAAAERLAHILEPWDVRCEIVDAAQASKVRALTPEQAKTWVGLDYASSGSIKPGAENPPQQAGYDLHQPVILLGAPEDNALTGFLERYGFLPYKPVSGEFPGRGRGMIAWQRDGLVREMESITLIAHDAVGMAEAIGSLYDAMTGLDPLTPWRLPASTSVVPAARPLPTPPVVPVAWEIVLPDRPVAVLPTSSGRAILLTMDGTLAAIDAKGKIRWQQELDAGHMWSRRLAVSADGGVIAVAGRRGLIVFNGSGKKLFESPRPAPVAVGHAVPVVTFVAVAPDGSLIADGAADGTITVQNTRGERQWSKPGWTLKSQFYFQNAVFSADGKRLVALTDKQASILNAADGAAIGQAEAFDCRFDPARAGDGLLLTDGKQVLSLLRPGSAEPPAKLIFPGTVCAAAALPQGFAIATENDGTVRAVKGLGGKLEDQVVWSYTAERRIVRKIVAGPMIAVVYWGGSVHLLDATGALRGVHAFSQDVAAAAWLGNTLIVGLADGRITALSVN